MFQLFSDANAINTISHLIQLAVAPVFLLAGVGAVLNVFVGRLSRVIDKAEILTEKLQTDREHKQIDKNSLVLRKKRNYLERRIKNMNIAILACTMTGLLISMVIMVMFLSAFFDFNGAFSIGILFIMAMSAFVTALSLFLKEIFMAAHYFKGKL